MTAWNHPCCYCPSGGQTRNDLRVHVAIEHDAVMPFTSDDRRTEAEFQSAIERVAAGYGWRSCHVRPSRVGKRILTPTSVPGWPDLWLLRERLVVLELKSHVGKGPTSEQRAWLTDLHAAHVATFLARPDDWPQLVEVLRGGEAWPCVGCRRPLTTSVHGCAHICKKPDLAA